jgi:hypothetical protein
MKSIVEVIRFLNHILEAQQLERIELVKKLQNEIWNDESIKEERLNEILSELAYDLDFYEPNEEWKTESSNYYGEERLEELIKRGMQKLEEYNKVQH